MDDFVRPRLRPGSLDTFLVRRAILAALRRERPRFHGLLLDLGCGSRPYREVATGGSSQVTGYLGVDLPVTVYGRPDVAWDGRRLPLADDTVGTVLLTEVLEHTPLAEAMLLEVARVLRPTGVVFVTVPFLWPLHEVPRDEWRPTPFALQRMLESAGFVAIDVRSLGGWDAAMAQMIGLWVRRRLVGPARNRIARWLLTWPSLAVMAILAGIDRAPERFEEGTMITGLAATAVKPPSEGAR